MPAYHTYISYVGIRWLKRCSVTGPLVFALDQVIPYVRPLVEYAASVWDPWQKKYIHEIKIIQHRAIRYIFNDYSFTSSVSNMLSKLNLPTLEKRRQISSLTMFYKIKHHLVNIPFPGNIQPSMRSRYTFPRSRINIHRYSFFPRTAKLWNNLPPDLCNSPDLGSFRAGLLKTLKKKADKNSSSSYSSISTSLNIFITNYINTIHDAFLLFFYTVMLISQLKNQKITKF